MKKKAFLTLRVPQELADKLDNAAEAKGVSRSEQHRRILERALRQVRA